MIYIKNHVLAHIDGCANIQAPYYSDLYLIKLQEHRKKMLKKLAKEHRRYADWLETCLNS